MTDQRYTTQLQAGLGMIEETDALLNLYRDDMTVPELSSQALDHGIFPTMSARRVRNVVAECFAPRFLVHQAAPAKLLVNAREKLSNSEIKQLYFLYTCRANLILADFVREVYWNAYAAGKTELVKDDAYNFVVLANQDGKTGKLWSDSTLKRVSSYLIGCCADFGLLESGNRKSTRQIVSFNLHRHVALFLAHDLHFSGLGDNAMISSSDWSLFGLDRFDAIQQVKSIGNDGHLLMQGVGGVIDVTWKYENMQEVIDAIH